MPEVSVPHAHADADHIEPVWTGCTGTVYRKPNWSGVPAKEFEISADELAW